MKPLVRMHSGFSPTSSTSSRSGDYSYLRYASSMSPSEYDYTPSPSLTLSSCSPTSDLSSLSPHTPPPELYPSDFPTKDIEKDVFDCDLSRHLLELEESMADPFTLIPGYSELTSYT